MFVFNPYLFTPAELLGIVVGAVNSLFLGLGIYYLVLEENKKKESFLFFSISIGISVIAYFFPIWEGFAGFCSFGFGVSLFVALLVLVIYLVLGNTDWKKCLQIAVLSLIIAVIFVIIWRVGNLAHFLKYIKFRK